jgi:ribosomal protein L29
MKFSELDGKSRGEILDMLLQKHKDIASLRIQHKLSQLAAPHTINLARREIAQLKMKLSQMSRGS